MKNMIELKYIEVKQPIGSFYLTKMTWNDLLEIAEADIRRIDDENLKGNSFDSYLGIQREVNPSRVKEIGDYVKTFDATFPTSIILSIQSKSYYVEGKEVSLIDYDNYSGGKEVNEVSNIEINDDKMFLRRSSAIASILDGQHRIEGLRNAFRIDELFECPNKDKFELNVTIFLDLDIDDQAQIFSVINKAQTKVNKSLVYDLYEYSKSRSPQKTAHDIVRILNRKEGSPFYKRIKILGKAVDKSNETITQATFVELIIGYISSCPMKDRDELRRKKKIANKYDPQRFIFSNYFTNENDELILNMLWNYFRAISEKWPNSWRTVGERNILNKSTGLIALMRLLRDIVVEYGLSGNSKYDDYKKIIDRSVLVDGSFTTDKYVPGSMGQTQLFNDLKQSVID